MTCATQVEPGLAAQLAKQAFLGDFRPLLPTLLLQCHDDPAVPGQVNAYLLAHLPCATLVMLGTPRT